MSAAAVDGRSRRYPPLRVRFMQKVLVVVPSGCWQWQAGKTVAGYGCILDGRLRLAHRVAYELFNGPIPDGLTIDHLCRNRSCVNPTHLEAVTNAENIRRGGQAAKTHCVHGHPFDAENTHYRSSGTGRACKTCWRDRARRSRERRKQAA